MNEYNAVKNSEAIVSKKVKLNTPLEKIIKSKKTLAKKDCKRLLSEIIKGFVRKEINSDDSKTLTYLLSVYIQYYSFLTPTSFDIFDEG